MCCCIETIYRRVILYTCTSNDSENNIFSDDITFITISKTSKLLKRKYTNLNNKPPRLLSYLLCHCGPLGRMACKFKVYTFFQYFINK